MIWRALETAVREPLAVYATTSSGGMFNLRVALRQRVPGEARNAIAACFGALANVKNVFVVDPDIDIFSDEQMDWALATRFQPDRDLVMVTGLRTLPLDPSLTPGTRTGAKAGFDLTWPFGTGGRLETRVPEPPQFAGKRFASVEAALGRRPEIFRGADDGGRQPRRPRGRARAGAAARQRHARPRCRRAVCGEGSVGRNKRSALRHLKQARAQCGTDMRVVSFGLRTGAAQCAALIAPYARHARRSPCLPTRRQPNPTEINPPAHRDETTNAANRAHE